MTLLGQQKNGPKHYQQLPPDGAARFDRSAAVREARGDQDSVGELVGRLSEQLSRLVRNELALAEAEAKQRGKRAGVAIGALGAGGILAFFGAAAFVTAAILAFSMIMRPWAAALVVGAFAFVFSGMIGTPGLWAMVRAGRGMGRESIENVKADVETVREAVRR
jgi:hypothetical protein